MDVAVRVAERLRVRPRSLSDFGVTKSFRLLMGGSPARMDADRLAGAMMRGRAGKRYRYISDRRQAGAPVVHVLFEGLSRYDRVCRRSVIRCCAESRLIVVVLSTVLLTVVPGSLAETRVAGETGRTPSDSKTGINTNRPVVLSVVLDEEKDKSSIKPPEGFDESAVVAERARGVGLQNPVEEKFNPVKFVHDAYALMAKDPVFKDLPSALVSPLSGASGRPCHYFVFLPEGYGPIGRPGAQDGAKWPLMVFLHGAGGNMKLGLWTMYPFLAKERYVAICPTYLDGQWWTPAGGKFLKKVLNDAQRKYAIDKTRVVVAGVSNGATGAWSVAKANSQEFWAVVSISGAFDGQESLLPTKGPPVYIAHGALDNVISVEFSRRAYKALARSRPNTAYKEYDDGGHLIFFTQRDDIMTSIFDWLRQLPSPASKGSR